MTTMYTTTTAPNLSTMPAYRTFADALALWDGENKADRRELVALLETLTNSPDFQEARRAIVGGMC